MDDTTIANLNNFRQLVELMETSCFSKVPPHQMVPPIYLASLSLLEKSEDIIIIFDTDGRYLYYNGSSKYNLTANDGHNRIQAYGDGAEVGAERARAEG